MLLGNTVSLPSGKVTVDTVGNLAIRKASQHLILLAGTHWMCITRVADAGKTAGLLSQATSNAHV